MDCGLLGGNEVTRLVGFFQVKDEGRGIFLLELEAPGKQGCTHSAVRLNRRDGKY